MLERLGIIETVRRKVVETFTSRAHRVRFDVAVQTSNSYVFNFAARRPPRRMAIWRCRLKATLWKTAASPPARVPEAKFRPETSSEIKKDLSPELAAVLKRLGETIEGRIQRHRGGPPLVAAVAARSYRAADGEAFSVTANSTSNARLARQGRAASN